jgi:hypothetical protein
MDIGVTEAARFDLHADLPVLERPQRDLLDGERTAEPVNDRGPVARRSSSVGLRLRVGDRGAALRAHEGAPASSGLDP